MINKINVGIVGFGLSGKAFHAPFIVEHPGFNLLKVVERHFEESKKIYTNVQVVRDISYLLEDPKIELIVITTPNRFHFQMAKDALTADKNVIVEKPFVINSREAEELIKIAKGKNKLLAVYQNRRWDGDFLTIKEILNQKLLGKLVSYESHFDRFRNYIKPNSWREKEDEAGSGILYDLGSHLIDQAISLFGKPNSVFADLKIQREGGSVIDYFDINLKYENLNCILKAGMLVKEPQLKFLLNGTKGSYIKYGLDPQEDELRKGNKPGTENWGKEDEENWGSLSLLLGNLNFKGKIETLPGNYMNFYQNIYDAIRQGRQPEVKLEESFLTIKIIEAAIESNAKGCKIEIVS